jgi:hypothetical protein
LCLAGNGDEARDPKVRPVGSDDDDDNCLDAHARCDRASGGVILGDGSDAAAAAFESATHTQDKPMMKRVTYTALDFIVSFLSMLPSLGVQCKDIVWHWFVACWERLLGRVKVRREGRKIDDDAREPRSRPNQKTRLPTWQLPFVARRFSPLERAGKKSGGTSG